MITGVGYGLGFRLRTKQHVIHDQLEFLYRWSRAEQSREERRGEERRAKEQASDEKLDEYISYIYYMQHRLFC
jgi:hypothetical protein